MSRDIVHAPLDEGGLAVLNLYVEQGIAHMERILRYVTLPDTITGHLLWASIEQATLELGLPGPFFSHDYAQWNKLVTDSWIKHSWQFQHKFNLQILPQTGKLEL